MTRARFKFLLALVSIVLFAIILLSSFKSLPLYVEIGDYGVARVFMVIPLFMSWHWWREYGGYKRGFEGELAVTRLLKSGLSDKFYLINDIKIKEVDGKIRNIDHVVLSPRAIFVIETKNWKGKLTANEDHWYTNMGNPTRQVKKNATHVKNFIESLKYFANMRIWVEPIIVFSNPDIDLHLWNMTVEVKKLNELLGYLLTFKGKNNYSSDFSNEELELIGKEIVQQSL